MSRFKILKCPLCGGKIEIDLDTGEIYRHFEKKKEKEAVDAFDQVVGKVAEKEHSTEDTFLESLFRQAAEKAKQDIESGKDEGPKKDEEE
jgi:hypothetical protein